MIEKLSDWEIFLHSYMPHIQLLGEIPITPANVDKLQELLRREIKIGGITKATQRIANRWPAAMVVYLAFKAAYNPEWNFWGNVAAGLGVSSPMMFFSESHHWGKTYLRLLESFGLPTFEDLEAGNQYIARIRLHGGIPAYSLPDFFTYLLLPSLQKPDLLVLEDPAAMRALLQSSPVQLWVDKPVQLFFSDGGDPALRFFSKCRSLARKALKGEPLPAPETLGLRPYLVEAFRQHWGLQATPAIVKTRRRWKAPKLSFSPYHPPGYQISLSEQVIPLEAAKSPFAWRLTGPEGEEETRPVRLRHSGHDVLSNALEVSLEETWPVLRVSFGAQGQNVPADLQRQWEFTLLPDASQPLLAFRYEDGAPLNSRASLPGGICWLLYPSGADLRFGGAARLIESPQSYWAPWDAWQAAAYDLSQADWVQVVPRDGIPGVPLPIETRQGEPVLQGGNLLAASLPVDDKPLYVGPPPSLCLPLPPGRTVAQALERWDLTLEARYAAEPDGRWERAALAPFAQVAPEDQNLILISLQSVLGPNPCGTYHLTCAGPDQSTYELPFRICPLLEVSGLEPYYLPDPQQGSRPVRFQVQVAPNSFILPADNHGNGHTRLVIQNGRTDGLFQLTVPENHSQADFLLEQRLPQKQVRLPVRLGVPRLRWALHLRPSDPIEWQASPLTRPLAEILQSLSPTLYVELPNHDGSELLLALTLLNPDTGAELHHLDTQTLGLRRERLSFNLKSFVDTLRTLKRASFVEIRLQWLDPGQNETLSLPVLRLTRALDVKVVWVDTQADGAWVVHWYEAQPLKHRHLYLWNEWQPWADPVDIPIPDEPERSSQVEEENWWMLPVPLEQAMMPPSRYRALFLVVSPFDHSVPNALPPDGTLCLETIEPPRRLQQIEASLAQQPGRAFALHFERACLYTSDQNIAKSTEEIQWCLAHWRAAPSMYLLAMHTWLGPRDSATQRAVRAYLYHPESIKKLLASPQKPEFLQAYLAPFPEANLLNPEAVEQVLHLSHDPAVVIHALEVLFKSKATLPQALDYILEQMEASHFADQDALDLLRPHLRPALERLMHCPPGPARERLIQLLVRDTPQPDLVVLPGYWVRSRAGWGRIETIRSGPEGQPKAFYCPGQDQPFLEVTLRPGASPERVAMDLAAGQMRFLDTETTYVCSKDGCTGFISALHKCVTKDHNRAAHMGIGAACYPAGNTFPCPPALQYRLELPEKEFE